MQFHFAPVQGHTDAAYRHFHSRLYNGDITYYTPFIRYERGGLRPKDLKDITSRLNAGIHLVPQIIFRDEEELKNLVKILSELDFKEIDLNMGCPFPLQTGHKRGAATIKNENLAKTVANVIKSNPEISFSVKMRLGLDNKDEWRTLLPYLNQVELTHLTVHPRIARQQYGGEVDLEQFSLLLKECKNPVIYNGDLKTPDDIKKVVETFPSVSGIMIGRGLLSRPSLIEEYKGNEEFEHPKRIARMLDFHGKLFRHYSEILCGDTQIISKISPFWEYAEDEIGRKAWKAIKKASNIAKYQSAVALIGE